MADWSAAISEAFNVAPADQVVLHTIELYHPDIVDENGVLFHPRFVRNHPNLTRWLNVHGAEAEAAVAGFSDADRDLIGLIARLESDAPYNPGSLVPFIAIAFDFDLPPVDPGQVPQMQVSVDNVGDEVAKHLEAAAVSSKKITMTYRPYLTSDLSQPHLNPPMTFDLINPVVKGGQVTGRGQLPGNLLKRAFPQRVYTVEDFPALASSN